MKKTRKTAVLVLCMALLLCSCGNGGSSSDNESTITPAESAASSNDSSSPESSSDGSSGEPESDEDESIKQKINDTIAGMMNAIEQDDSIKIDKETVGDDIAALYETVNQTGCYPVYKGTKTEYYPMGDYALEPMLEELEKAEDFIFFEYCIVDEGEFWDKIFDVLKRKAAEGVDVRVIYDSIITAAKLEPGFYDNLINSGIKVNTYGGDHRKITVVDGKVAFTGGMNIADEYINVTHPYGVWKDNAIKITGCAVNSFTLMFLNMWDAYEGEEDISRFLCASNEDGESDGYIMPYCDNPNDDVQVARGFYMSMLETAKDYVYIITPYLMPDEEFENAIIATAKRGVEVKIYTPSVSDFVAADMIVKSHYRALLEAGVKIFEFRKGFIHSKVFLSDDTKAIVGTVNLDNRSFVYNFEDAAYFYKASVIDDIKKEFDDNEENYIEITTDNISAVREAGGNILKSLEGLL